jgi:hypothetical protein
MEDMQVAERRWCVRKAIIMAVTLHHQGRQLSNCKTRDIGVEGIFIETDTAAMDVHDVLEVSLPTSVIGAGQCRRIPAMAVHKRGNGVGLMFCSFDQRLYECLCGLIESLPASHAA